MSAPAPAREPTGSSRTWRSWPRVTSCRTRPGRSSTAFRVRRPPDAGRRRRSPPNDQRHRDLRRHLPRRPPRAATARSGSTRRTSTGWPPKGSSSRTVSRRRCPPSPPARRTSPDGRSSPTGRCSRSKPTGSATSRGGTRSTSTRSPSRRSSTLWGSSPAWWRTRTTCSSRAMNLARASRPGSSSAARRRIRTAPDRARRSRRWPPGTPAWTAPTCSAARCRDGGTRQYLLNNQGRHGEEDYLVARVMDTGPPGSRTTPATRPSFCGSTVLIRTSRGTPRNPTPTCYDPGFSGPEPVFALHHRWAELSEAHQRRARALYAGEVSLVDRWIGHLLDRLQALGLAQETAVFFTTDHGTDPRRARPAAQVPGDADRTRDAPTAARPPARHGRRRPPP